MIKVCDAIMGSGKTQAAITYMNERPLDKFVYITPYLEEAHRIKESCPQLGFVEPNTKLPQYEHRKKEHTRALIKAGENVATTHQAFTMYDDDMLKEIQNNSYTLIVDEELGMLKSKRYHTDDIELAIQAGIIGRDRKGALYVKNEEYQGSWAKDLIDDVKRHHSFISSRGDFTEFLYWELPVELVTAFKDVYILTYLFEGQSLQNLLKLHSIGYCHIYVAFENGIHRFADNLCYIPDYVARLPNMIDVLDDERLNEIGDKRASLSNNWYKQNQTEVEQMKRNLQYYFRTYCRGKPSQDALWASFKSSRSSLVGHGMSRNFLVFNERATNKYKRRTCLAYPVNIYLPSVQRSFYRTNNIQYSEDAYALSTMLQWIWRSAIRDGNPIQLYIPSRRMRTLLQNWIKDTSESAVKFQSTKQNNLRGDA